MHRQKFEINKRDERQRDKKKYEGTHSQQQQQHNAAITTTKKMNKNIPYWMIRVYFDCGECVFTITALCFVIAWEMFK